MPYREGLGIDQLPSSAARFFGADGPQADRNLLIIGVLNNKDHFCTLLGYPRDLFEAGSEVAQVLLELLLVVP